VLKLRTPAQETCAGVSSDHQSRRAPVAPYPDDQNGPSDAPVHPGAPPRIPGPEAQTYRSGTNDIDALDYVEMFLDDETQTNPVRW
jgi:hypothetical protein